MAENRRPWHGRTAALAASHNAFELATGVGLILQRELGLPLAALAWSAALGSLGLLARRGGERFDALLASSLGASLAGVVIHFTLWPWRLRAGVPVLVRAEGIERRYLPAYNFILVAWAGTALCGSALEVPAGKRRWVLAGFLAGLPCRWHARRHFMWMAEQARMNPAWWNRAGYCDAGDALRDLPVGMPTRAHPS